MAMRWGRAGVTAAVLVAAATGVLPAQGAGPVGPAPRVRVPPVMVQAGITGTVIARVPVDSAGRPDAAHAVIVHASDPLLVVALRSALPALRLTPPGGRTAARDTAAVVVHFTLPADTSLPRAVLPSDAAELLARRVDPDSGEVLTFGWPARDTTAPPPTIASEVATSLIAVRSLLGDAAPRGDSGAVACVGVSLGGAEAELTPAQLAQAAVPGVSVMARPRCNGFADGVGRVRAPSAGPRPMIQVLVTTVERWRAGIEIVRGTMRKGTGGVTYRCWVDTRSATPVVRCVGERDLVF